MNYKQGPNNSKIPHIIHYFWFGGGSKPESVEKCITSWRKFCPDFEIREWNENNYDVHKHPFMEKAYHEKKWAFVSDYARLDVLYNYGGIYLDTDVEVIKDLSPLCENEGYIGFETPLLVNDGQGFGCSEKMPVIHEMLAIYDSDEAFEYIDEKKQFIESPRLRTMILLKHGLKQDGTRQKIAGMEIYPADYFSPKNYKSGKIRITSNTYSIHHYDSSWKTKNNKKYFIIMRVCYRVLGDRLGEKAFDNLMKFKDVIKKAVKH